MNSKVESVKQKLAHLRGELQTLQNLLEQERCAIKAHDLDAIAAVTDAKSAACQSLAQAMQGPQLSQLMQELPEAERQELDADHNSVLALADVTRDSNVVNGKIIARTQQSTRELLAVLSGRELEGLYGTSGRTDASGESATHEIAKA
jgi:flagellar biosynthesis/type III secretory pathway chaperone